MTAFSRGGAVSLDESLFAGIDVAQAVLGDAFAPVNLKRELLLGPRDSQRLLGDSGHMKPFSL
jgi:hypothetical protein